MQGKIIKGIAGFYYIYAENDEIYECKAKGIFRKDKQKPLVGDNVEIEVLDEQEKEGSVTAILPRKNSLIRPAVANVDQAFVIFAMENPKPNFMLLDRFLIMMEKENVPAVICFNKKDLAKQEELELLYETYKSCGYDVIFSSTFNGEGLDEIREILKGKTTVVAGPSGVGKSSITNALQENVQMETKAFVGGVLSGIVEPVGAVLTILAAGLIVPALPYLLSFAAGAMLYVVVEELIPEMSAGEHSNIGTIFFAVGFSLMMILDVALG